MTATKKQPQQGSLGSISERKVANDRLHLELGPYNFLFVEKVMLTSECLHFFLSFPYNYTHKLDRSGS